MAAVVAASLVAFGIGGCTGSRDGGAGVGGATDSPGAGPSGQAGQGRSDNPLAGLVLYTDPFGPSVKQVDEWNSGGRAADARQLNRIAGRPIAHWVGAGSPEQTRAEVDSLVGRAARQNRAAVLVAYNVPHRDCGNYSAGGAKSGAEYQRWLRALIDGIAGRPAIVVLEPDAVAHTLDGCMSQPKERYALLSGAVRALKSGTGTRVYLDAGNPSWVKNVGKLAGALRAAGVEDADGFALNVANFVTTKENVAYGTRLSDELGGAHFVIDTSRNGAGPPPGSGTVDGGPAWCNPAGRKLGTPPTTDPGLPRVDALLWVKRPGDSDGACRPGEPPAGQWWPEYALDLARRSTN